MAVPLNNSFWRFYFFKLLFPIWLDFDFLYHFFAIIIRHFKTLMATVNQEATHQAFDNLVKFISKQPNFPAIFTHTVHLLKASLKIPEFPPTFYEITSFYITIHKENFMKSIFVKKKVVLVWLVSAFILLTGKPLENLVIFIFSWSK